MTTETKTTPVNIIVGENSDLSVEEQKKLAKRLYQREYMRNRRQNDTEFREKCRMMVRTRNNAKYNDPSSSFKDEKTKYNIAYYEKFKDLYKEARQSVKQANK